MAHGFGKDSTAEEVTEGRDLTGQSWVITGANSGLGRESARVLALRGARIIALARTEAKAAAALEQIGAEGHPVACELSDLRSVSAAVERVRSVAGPLHGIMANAGIMALPELAQQHGYEQQFFTNHIGHFHLVTGLIDQLGDTGRVVIVSSGAHFYAKDRGMEMDNLSGETAYDAWRMYGRSKLANILFAKSLARRFAGSGRTANALHPGVIETNLGRHVPDKDAMYTRFKPILRTIAQGAATQCYLATHPALADVSGRYFSDCDVADTIPQADDDALADALWARSEQIVAEVLGEA